MFVFRFSLSSCFFLILSLILLNEVLLARTFYLTTSSRVATCNVVTSVVVITLSGIVKVLSRGARKNDYISLKINLCSHFGAPFWLSARYLVGYLAGYPAPLPGELLGGCEAVFQIGDDVIDVFGADGKTDGIGFDALLLLIFCADLGMGGGGGMDDE